MKGMAMPSSGVAVPVRKPPLTAFQYIISLMTHRSCSLYFRSVCDTTSYRVAQKLLDTACTGPGVVIAIGAGQLGDCVRTLGTATGPSSSQKVPTIFGAHAASHLVGGRGSTPEDKVATHPHLVPRLRMSGFCLPHTPSWGGQELRLVDQKNPYCSGFINILTASTT
jgi:hypothetical protein